MKLAIAFSIISSTFLSKINSHPLPNLVPTDISPTLDPCLIPGLGEISTSCNSEDLALQSANGNEQEEDKLQPSFPTVPYDYEVITDLDLGPWICDETGAECSGDEFGKRGVEAGKAVEGRESGELETLVERSEQSDASRTDKATNPCVCPDPVSSVSLRGMLADDGMSCICKRPSTAADGQVVQRQVSSEPETLLEEAESAGESHPPVSHPPEERVVARDGKVRVCDGPNAPDQKGGSYFPSADGDIAICGED